MPGPVINVEMILSQKSNEGNVELPSHLYSKARWSAYGRHHGNSGHQCLLQQFKAGTPRQQKQLIPQRCSIGKEFSANEPINGIVTAHIFAYCQQLASGIEEPRAV